MIDREQPSALIERIGSARDWIQWRGSCEEACVNILVSKNTTSSWGHVVTEKVNGWCRGTKLRPDVRDELRQMRSLARVETRFILIGDGSGSTLEGRAFLHSGSKNRARLGGSARGILKLADEAY